MNTGLPVVILAYVVVSELLEPTGPERDDSSAHEGGQR